MNILLLFVINDYIHKYSIEIEIEIEIEISNKKNNGNDNNYYLSNVPVSRLLNKNNFVRFINWVISIGTHPNISKKKK